MKKNQQIRYEQSVVVKRRTFCIMGQRVRKKSKLNPLGVGLMKMENVNVEFFFLDPKPGDLAMSKLKKW